MIYLIGVPRVLVQFRVWLDAARMLLLLLGHFGMLGLHLDAGICSHLRFISRYSDCFGDRILQIYVST